MLARYLANIGNNSRFDRKQQVKTVILVNVLLCTGQRQSSRCSCKWVLDNFSHSKWNKMFISVITPDCNFMSMWLPWKMFKQKLQLRQTGPSDWLFLQGILVANDIQLWEVSGTTQSLGLMIDWMTTESLMGYSYVQQSFDMAGKMPYWRVDSWKMSPENDLHVSPFSWRTHQQLLQYLKGLRK